MGLRFQKRIRLFKGLTLNLSKTGTSWTLGGRGASINIKDGKAVGSVGIPGTGLSYRHELGDDETTTDAQESTDSKRSIGFGTIFMIVVLVAVGYFFGRAA